MENYDVKALMRALAHEIRTPLGVVMGYAALLDGDDAFPPEERAAIIVRMKDAGSRIHDVLAGMENGTLTLRLDTLSRDSIHVRGTNQEEQSRAESLSST